MHDVFVGLGSNIDPESNLLRALDALAGCFGIRLVSSVYRSPPYGFVGEDFLNIVVMFESSDPPQQIEDALSAIEYSEGRTRAGSQVGPRTLDLDLLIYGHMVDPRLRLPRDDVLRYPFVVAPLAEIAPQLEEPLSGRPMLDAWSEMSAADISLERIGTVDCLLVGLPTDAAAAVDGEHLPGDVRRIADEK
jgi:2-amino-4-hydroxy-6-hydroxymethyldihydropteridine diphosphokinase